MAHQDYVSKSNNKKNNPYKKSKDVEPKRFTLKVKIITLLTLVALAVFGYFLWTIKDNETSLPSDNNTLEQKQRLTQPKKSSIPDFDEDKDYEFMQGLKNKDVKGGEYETAEQKQYGLYCASFREYSRADTLKAKIAFAGVASKIKTKKGSNGTWHQVYIGPYPNKRAAEAEKHKLIRNKVPPCSLRAWK